MLKTRVIPCLQLIGESLVKTVKFKNPQYIGDPINTVRIFNEIEVDELCFLDIRASIEGRAPSFDFLKQIADEAFMPMSYGGGITSLEQAKTVFSTGFEKVVLNTSAFRTPWLISEIASHFGNQAVIVSIDYKRNLWGNPQVFIKDGTEKSQVTLEDWAVRAEELGAGEILLTSMDRDGTWSGFDIPMIKSVTDLLSVPVIANGGAGDINDIQKAVKQANASAVALGSMVVYQQKGMGVLVNFPDRQQLDSLLK